MYEGMGELTKLLHSPMVKSFHEGRSHNRTVGVAEDVGDLLGRRNTQTYADALCTLSAQSSHERLGRLINVFPRAGNAHGGDGVDESL